jgi:hypothetical protein
MTDLDHRMPSSIIPGLSQFPVAPESHPPRGVVIVVVSQGEGPA